MSDTNDEVVFDTPQDDRYEIEVLQPGQEAPETPPKVPTHGDRVELTKEEHEALVARGDSSRQLGESLKELVTKLQNAPAANLPQAQVVDTYNPEALEAQVFEAGKTVKTVEQIAQRVMSQQQGAQLNAMIEQSKMILKLNPKTAETYTMFEAEIERRVQALPPQYRAMPDVYNRVHQQVLLENQDTIVEAKAKKMAEDIVKNALAQQGTKQQATAPLRNEQGSIMAPAVVTTTKKLYITESGRQEMLESCMDPKDPLQVQLFLNRKKGR